MQENVSSQYAQSLPPDTATASLFARHTSDSLAAQASFKPTLHSALQHNKQQKHKGAAAAAPRHGTAHRNSLTQISMNLPEAPAAFRHMPQTSQSYVQLSEMLKSDGAAEYRASAPFSSGISAHSSRLSSLLARQVDASVMTLLPESPRRRLDTVQHILPGHQLPQGSQRTVQHSVLSNHQLPQSSQGNVASTGVILPNAEARDGAGGPMQAAPGAEGLFGGALLDGGPPRLAASGSGLVAATQGPAEIVDGLATMQSVTVHHCGSTDAMASENAVKLPLRPSDFSR